MKNSLLESGSIPKQIAIVSNTPGRLRLRLPSDARDPETMAQIAAMLPALVGAIDDIRTNPQTGSVTIYHNWDSQDFSNLLTILKELGITVENQPFQTPAIATRLTQAIARVNERVDRATHGAADLRFLVPFALVLVSLRQLFGKSAHLKTAPWYVLAWYAFDMFLKLNQQQDSQPNPGAPVSPSVVHSSDPPPTPQKRSSKNPNTKTKV